MILPEIFHPLFYPLLLVVGLTGNLGLVIMYLRKGYSIRLSLIVFLFTLVVLGLTVPHYYSAFKLDLMHFLEHSSLKLLFVLGAVNLLFLLRVLPSPMLHVTQNMNGDATTPVISQQDDGIEELYTTLELEVFAGSLSHATSGLARSLEQLEGVSASFDVQIYVENAPQYIRNIVVPVEDAINRLWNLLASRSESIPRILSTMQTGLLSHNLILVLSFLLLFITLIIFVPGAS